MGNGNQDVAAKTNFKKKEKKLKKAMQEEYLRRYYR
jgi:hypothetical protein